MSVVFFTDRDLGNVFPDILIAAGLNVERHRDHFAPDCRDEDWLEEIGVRRWVAITHDGRIRYRPNQLAVVKRHCVSLLVIVGRDRHSVLASNFVATHSRIESFLARHGPPFIAKVYRPTEKELARRSDAPGSVSLWYPRE